MHCFMVVIVKHIQQATHFASKQSDVDVPPSVARAQSLSGVMDVIHQVKHIYPRLPFLSTMIVFSDLIVKPSKRCSGTVHMYCALCRRIYWVFE